MQETQQPQKEPNKKAPFFVSYLIVILIVLMMNAFLFPALMGHRIQAVDYGTFIRMLDGGQLTTVQIEDEQIYFADTDNTLYQTNTIPQDYQLVPRLEEAGVSFGRVYQKQSLLSSILVNWVLPFLPLVLIATWFSRMVNKKMAAGGNPMNAMMFGGKSGAKQYVVDDKTGIKFSDVAGQEEAK